jgi:hypothetical protein
MHMRFVPSRRAKSTRERYYLPAQRRSRQDVRPVGHVYDFRDAIGGTPAEWIGTIPDLSLCHVEDSR